MAAQNRWPARCFSALIIATILTPLGARSGPLPSTAQTKQPAAAAEWGVVLGGDRTAVGASDEVRRNSKILNLVPRIYRCEGWYRTVAAFASKREALLGLAKVLDSGSTRSPYIISIKEWCPGKKLIPSP